MAVGTLSSACTEPDTDGRLRALSLAVVDGAAEARPPWIVESPQAALARAAQVSAAAQMPFDATACLQAWCASARSLLREAQLHPGQVVLLDADEVHAAPAAARAAWRRHAGFAVETALAPTSSTTLPPPPRVDALGLAAAALVVAQHTDAPRLWCELQGSCLLLQDAALPAVAPAAELALQAWREWQLNLADLRQTLGDTQARLAETQQRLGSREAELAEAHDEASLAELMRRQSLTELESLSTRAAQAEAVSQDRQARLEAAEARLAACEHMLNDERHAHAQELQRNQSHQAQLADLQAQLAHRESELQQRTGALQSALDGASAAIARERTAQLEERQQIEAQLDTLRRDRARFTVLVERSRQEIDHLLQQRDAERAAVAQQIDQLLRQREAERAATEAERADAQTAQAGLAGQIAELQQQLAAAHHETESLAAEAARQAEEHALDNREWLEQIAAWQQESERLHREADELRDALARSAQQAQLAEDSLQGSRAAEALLTQREQALQQALTTLRQELEQSSERLRQALDEALSGQARTDALAAELSQLRERQRSTDASEAAWQRRWQQARVRQELLECQLGDALGGLVRNVTPAPATLVGSSLSWSSRLAGTRLVLLGERDTAPHRELALAVELPAAAQAPAARFELRLVEHGGRPGLVWLPDSGGTPPLHAWQPNGHEIDRPFMRLVPQDADGAALLARLPSADWRLLLGLAEQLPQWVGSATSASSELWRTVARRLLTQLRAQPARLRFSELQATWLEPTPGATGTTGLAHIRLSDVLFGNDALADIELAFDSTGERDTTLSWLLPANAAPAVASWPVQADGRLHPHCPVAVGRVQSVRSKWRWWAERPARDRELLIGVLDALPAAADALGSLAQAPVLRQKLADLHREARRLVDRQALGSRLRRLKNLLR